MYIYPTNLSASNFGRTINTRRIDRTTRPVRPGADRRINSGYSETSLKDMPIGYLPSGRAIKYNAHSVINASIINNRTATQLYNHFLEVLEQEQNSEFGFEDRVSEDATKYTFFRIDKEKHTLTIGEFEDNNNDPIQRTCVMQNGKPTEIRVDFINREEANIYTFNENGRLVKFLQDTETQSPSKMNSSLFCKMSQDGLVSYAYANSDIEGGGVVDADTRIIYNWDSQFFEDEKQYGAAEADETVTADVTLSQQGPKITRVFSTTAPRRYI